MTLTKSVRISKKGQFVLPKEMRDALGVGEGDQLQATLKGRQIIITSPEDFAHNTRGLFKGTWGKNEQEVRRYLEKERRSWR
jgi:AbrB family looped-hinge helix DNA binding protein